MITANNKDESFISVITVINRFTADSLSRLSEIQSSLDLNFSDYEIILVVQKSMQNVLSNKLLQILKDVPCIRYLQLSSLLTIIFQRIQLPLDVYHAGL